APGARGVLGRNMMRLANSPLNPAMQIALGFTLFRFTGGIIKNVRDRIMNEKNTTEETNFETRNWWKTIKQTMRVNWPAESIGTPIAALVLGFMNAAFIPSAQSVAKRDIKAFPGWSGYWKQLAGKEGLWSKESKLLQNAGVWTLS